MKDLELETVIAERVLASPILNHEVRVRIGSPQEKGGDFVTPYQIAGAGDERVRFAAGLDAVQSLQLVFHMIGADIHGGLKEYRLRWADRDDPGFPAP